MTPLVAATLALTACSGGDSTSAEPDASSEPSEKADPVEEFAALSAEEIQAAALDAMRRTRTVRMTGTIVAGGERIFLDVRVAPSGDCTGALELQRGSTQFTRIAKQGWIRPDNAFWRATAPERADQIIKAVAGKWVEVPPSSGSFDETCDVDSMLETLDTGVADVTVGDLDTVDGRDAVPLEIAGDQPSIVWVAAEEPHHVLLLQNTGGTEPGRITFGAFDSKAAVRPPPQAEVARIG